MQNIKDYISKSKENIPVEVTKQNRFYSLLMILIGISSVGLFLSFLNFFYIRQIAKKPFPSLVQLSDGETIEIDFMHPNYRRPAVIKQFVADTLYNLMSMTSYSPNDNRASALDPTRKLAEPFTVERDGVRGKITQSAWLASANLEPKFAESFRSKLAEMTPDDVFQGKEEVILHFNYIKTPEKQLDEQGGWRGTWEVDVVGHLNVYRRTSGEVKSIPFNKRVTVRQTSTIPITDVEQFGPLAVTINKISQAGLQITNITDLEIADVF